MSRANYKNVISALDIRFDSDAGDNLTVRDYIYKLIETLWDEQDCFSGKRPFGNSNWEAEIYVPLIKAGLVKGELDEDGCFESVDEYGHSFVKSVIHYAIYGPVKG